MWCKVKAKVDEHLLVEQALKEKVVFAPGSIFGTKQGYFRFTYGRSEIDNIYEGITRFKKTLGDIVNLT